MSVSPQVVVVMGVSGSGKTTLAYALAQAWPGTFLDADDFHSDAAKAHMAKGEPLTDDMREPWVLRLRDELIRRTNDGERVVLAFSGLRRQHRDQLRAAGLPLIFLFLQGSQELISARMRARMGHYMPVTLLDSQFAALQVPRDEADVVSLGIDGTPEELLAFALSLVSVSQR